MRSNTEGSSCSGTCRSFLWNTPSVHHIWGSMCVCVCVFWIQTRITCTSGALKDAPVRGLQKKLHIQFHQTGLIAELLCFIEPCGLLLIPPPISFDQRLHFTEWRAFTYASSDFFLKSDILLKTKVFQSLSLNMGSFYLYFLRWTMTYRLV